MLGWRDGYAPFKKYLVLKLGYLGVGKEETVSKGCSFFARMANMLRAVAFGSRFFFAVCFLLSSFLLALYA